jgi:hypothetical protein
MATASGRNVCRAIQGGLLGQIVTPTAGNKVLEGADWIADNACFAPPGKPSQYPGDEKYLTWLQERAHREKCRFAAAPDVVADAAATLARSAPMFGPIRNLGYPVALVAQDGLESMTVPWNAFDALFIGGSDYWKLSTHAHRLILEAKSRGKWVHMGRVNSRKRLRSAIHMGCDSVDGGFLIPAPDENLPKLLQWLRELADETTYPTLWEAS